MPIRAVVLDIGGVLETTIQTGYLEKWESQLGLSSGEMMDRLGNAWGEGGTATIDEVELQRRLIETTGMDEAQRVAFTDDFWTEYLGELNVELADYFASLRPRYKTGILSNSFMGAREREQARFHFDEMADLIIYSHEVGLLKPDQRIFQLTCDRLGVQPGEMIFLDDHEPHIMAANAFGIVGIHFKNTAQAIADIQARLDG